MFNIRDFVPADEAYEAIFAVETAVWPENATTAAEFKHADATRDPARFFRRVVAEVDGRIVAFASYREVFWSQDKGRYRFNITVHPDYERRGVGTAVYNHILNDLNHGNPQPAILESGTYAHKTQGVRFLQERGFVQVMRWVISTLDVPTFDAGRFDNLRQKIAAEGIVIRPLTEQKQHDPHWRENLYELDWALAQDEPLPYPPKKLPFADYVNQEIEAPNVLHDAWFVALANGRYIGMTQLLKNETIPTQCSTGFTGVIREYRRRGLATLLKIYAAEYARQAGIHLIRTGNEESNPMYDLNVKLGFEDLTASLAFEKRLGS